MTLDDVEEIKKLDSNNVVESIKSFGDQLKTAWQELRLVEIPLEYRNVKNIVVAGMGGSCLGAHFVRSVFDLSLPLQIVNDYFLPTFVKGNTLLVVSSYSGDTEETLSAFSDGQKREAKILGISSGGKLVEELKQKSLPFYQFGSKYNPSGKPRLGLGYSIGATLGVFAKLGFLNFTDQDLEKVVNSIEKMQLGPEIPVEKNAAKALATALNGKIPVIFASEFLAGNAPIFANDLNETAKVFSAYFLIPEANHHLLEGISFPNNLKEIIKFVFLESDNYSLKIKARCQVTKDLLGRNQIEYVTYKIVSQEKQTAAFESLIFSSWVSFYLAILYETNPGPIPNVDFFKE